MVGELGGDEFVPAGELLVAQAQQDPGHRRLYHFEIYASRIRVFWLEFRAESSFPERSDLVLV